jgi:hypothetical protein
MRIHMRTAMVGWCSALLSCIALPACSGDDDGPNSGDPSAGSGAGTTGSGAAGLGNDSGGSGGSRSGSGGSGGGSLDGGVLDPNAPTGTVDGGGATPNGLLLCGDRACQCSDGIDNDGDGFADGFDFKCTGPLDDDESSFSTGIPGDNRDPFWQDCFFDGNSGAGDDKCRYHTECLTGVRDPSHSSCTVVQACIDFCQPRTPNGCDCFGCCTVRLPDGSDLSIVLSSACDPEHLDRCTTCTPSTQCNNECGECELCPGKTIADLPQSCSPPSTGGSGGVGGIGGTGGNTGGTGGSGTPVTCDNGAPVCLSQEWCPAGTYCSWGCCTSIGPD